MRMVVTSVQDLRGSASNVVSYDIPASQRAGNTMHRSHISVDLNAVHLGLWQASLKSRLGDTSPESSLWVSATALRAMAALGSSHSSRLVVSVGTSPGSISSILSYDIPSVHFGHEEVDEGVRIEGIPFSRSGVGENITMRCRTTQSSGDHFACHGSPATLLFVIVTLVSSNRSSM
jgi:hypothetical protein